MAFIDERRTCGWCLESLATWVADVGGFGFCLCDSCLASLDGIATEVKRALWAKEVSDGDAR